MGWSAGTFTKVHDWTDEEAAANDIESVKFDQQDDNFTTGINNCLTKDGQNTPTGDLPMGGQKHTGVGNAAAKTDYASAADVMDQHLIYYVDSGSADAYVVTPSPSYAAYAEGQRIVFRATNTNTTTSTLNANALGAIVIQTPDGNALTAGMIVDGGYYDVVYDANTTPDRWVLLSTLSLTPTITAGAGLTGGGDLPADLTITVGAGTGITVNADDVAVDAASALNVDHSATSVIAGAGMTGGGTIDADATLNVIAGTGITVNANDVALAATAAGAGLTHTSGVLDVVGGNGITANANDVALTDAAATTTNPVDISSGVVSLDAEALTTIEGRLLAATDTFYVEDAGVSKGIEVQEMGLRVQTGQTTQTLAAADMNSIMEFTATATLTLPLNATTALPIGTPVVLNVKHATQALTVTADTSVTLVSSYHPAGGSAASDTVVAGGTAILFKTAADVWCLSGDITD